MPPDPQKVLNHVSLSIKPNAANHWRLKREEDKHNHCLPLGTAVKQFRRFSGPADMIC